MLTDLPKIPPPAKIRLFADDVTIVASCKQPSDAEVTIQPALDRLHRWFSKWKLKLSPDKSAIVVFTRSYKPGPDPLLFINGHPIPSKPRFKFLGVWFDQKLLWKYHIEQVHAHCINLKNLFKIIANSKCGPPAQTLFLLYKTLVRSKTDYGLIAYGNASKSSLSKIDIACRAIIRIILGAKSSTPMEILYAESSSEPISTRRLWLASKYLIKLGHKPYNPAFTLARSAFLNSIVYPPQKHTLPLRHHPILEKARLRSLPGYPTIIPPSLPAPKQTPPVPNCLVPAVKEGSRIEQNQNGRNIQWPTSKHR
jgi:hypothetical protein